MATTLENLVPEGRTGETVDHSLVNIKAPFLLRSAAWCIDYILFIAVPVTWLIATKYLTDLGTTAPGMFVFSIEAIVIAVNFILFPLLLGQSIGKLIAGITIVNIDGSELKLMGVIRRNVLGYAITALTLGLGLFLCALNPSGRSLHDLIGGTIVVRGRREQI